MITASKSRQKHQQELLHSALLTEEISKRVAREHFTLSTVSILSAASYALLAHQSKDEDDDGEKIPFWFVFCRVESKDFLQFISMTIDSSKRIFTFDKFKEQFHRHSVRPFFISSIYLKTSERWKTELQVCSIQQTNFNVNFRFSFTSGRKNTLELFNRRTDAHRSIFL